MVLETENVQGFCAPAYENVKSAFSRLFAESGEQGAAVCVYRQGQLVLSLWGGTRNKAGDLPWHECTQVNAFSANKGLVALCVLRLVETGALDLDQTVAHYWPEFAEGGKAGIRVRDILCHRSGVSAFRERVPDELIYDWPGIVARVAAEEPWWSPGTEQGYSPMLYGWVLGELVRRASGEESFDHYFQQHIAGPLGVDCGFGLAESQQLELADVGPLKVTNPSANELAQAMKSDPGGVVNRAFTNPMSLMMGTNSAAWRGAQIPAANGHTSARALGAIYGALASDGSLQVDGIEQRLLSTDTLPLCWQEQSRSDADRVLGAPLRFGLGFMLSGNRDDCRFGRGARGFGHPGAGGCLGFADPDAAIGFGYVTNRMGQGLLIDPRARSLIDAVYECEDV